MFKKTILFLILQCIYVFGWHDTQHMIIAQIAKNKLPLNTQKQLDKLFWDTSGYFNNSDNIFLGATWLDYISNKNFMRRSCHSKKILYDPEEILSKEEQEVFNSNIEKDNVTNVIYQALNILKNPKSTLWQKGFMIRVLIHCVGDAHMPLHCTMFYNKQFPKSDWFGTKFKIITPFEKIDNLHSLWDSCFGIDLDISPFIKNLKKSDIEIICDFANKINAKYHKRYIPELNNMDINKWVEESYLISVNYIYKVELNKKISEEYIKTGQEICFRQLYIAGDRLSKLLKDIFKDK